MPTYNKSLSVSVEELDLIEHIRHLGYRGRIIVHIEDNGPVRIEEERRSIKLGTPLKDG